MAKGEMKKIRVIEECLNIFEEYRPQKGEIYDAEYSIPWKFKK